ncbi:MAG: hypothetical protein ABSF03_20740 [Streptosporangiaceae bacterium]
MIGRVLPRGGHVAGLLYYLYGPGKACEHTHPHLVSGWRHPAELEPPLRPDGTRDFRMLTGLLLQPVAAAGDRAPARPVWHCAVRAAPGDPDLGDGAWMAIAAEIMDRTGLSRRGEEDDGVRWIAVHHGGNHIHIVATLARQDGHRARPGNDYYRIGEALRDIEAEYGLQVVARADRTAAKNPTRAEYEKAARAGRPEPARVTLRRQVGAAAARTRSEPEFFAELARRQVKVRLRHSSQHPAEVTGYAVALPGHTTAAGDPVWYGGGKLAPDLTLPKLRRRWAPAGHPCPRLSGHGMSDAASRAALRRETGLAAAAARSEPEFFTALERAGLLVRFRDDPARPGQVAGYAVSLPGLAHYRDGQQVWYGGGQLAPELALPALRRRWQAGRAGAAPAAGVFAGQDAEDIFRYAADVAAAAARQIAAAPGTAQAADAAWAAADVLAVAAEGAASPALAQAAERFSRAARASWGQIPAPSPAGAGLRTAAYLLAACGPGGQQRSVARVALITALAGLAGAVTGMRAAQQRLLQAAAARAAAGHLTAAAATVAPGPAPAAASARMASADFPAPPVTVRPAAPRPGRRPPRRPGPGQRPGPRPPQRGRLPA